MKVDLNPAFEGMRGSVGGFVYRRIRGKTIISRKPILTGEPTANQTAQRDRFKLAAAYGKSVMGNSQLRPQYEEVARRRDVPVFSVMVSDFFNAPVITELDLHAYNGQPGDPIKVNAFDDFGVENVRVFIVTEQGVTLESGQAVETMEGSGEWVYTATALAPSQNMISVQAYATDHPGSTAFKTSGKSIQ